MKISVRMEGGLGDHILANRFIPAILDKYNNAEIHLFSDTGGNSLQSNVLTSLYKHYASSTLIYRKGDQHKISSQFGTENFAAHLDNIKSEDKKLMKSFDKFYNIHIDWMEWLDFDFDWQRYFYHFPKPDSTIMPLDHDKPYIIIHAASDNLGNNHRMPKKYLNSLISNIPPTYDIFILSTKSTQDFISSTFEETNRIKFFQKNIQDVIRLVKGCAGMFAIDSGIKYFGYTFNKPTLTWAKESQKPHSCLPAFQMRWLTFPSLIFPLQFDASYLCQCMENLIKSNNLFLAPHLNLDEINKVLIRRKIQS